MCWPQDTPQSDRWLHHSSLLGEHHSGQTITPPHQGSHSQEQESGQHRSAWLQCKYGDTSKHAMNENVHRATRRCGHDGRLKKGPQEEKRQDMKTVSWNWFNWFKMQPHTNHNSTEAGDRICFISGPKQLDKWVQNIQDKLKNRDSMWWWCTACVCVCVGGGNLVITSWFMSACSLI